MHGHALRVHVGEALLEVDEFRRERAVRFYGRLEEEALLGHAKFGVELLAIRIEQIEVGLREIVRVNVDGARSGLFLRGRLGRRGEQGIAHAAHRGYGSRREPSLKHFSAGDRVMATAHVFFFLHGTVLWGRNFPSGCV